MIWIVLIFMRKTRNPEVDGCQSNIFVMLKQLLIFINFTTSFLGVFFDKPTVLFQFMQHDNFRNLNRVIFTY